MLKGEQLEDTETKENKRTLKGIKWVLLRWIGHKWLRA
jgi:hypothetical protein